MVPGTSVPNSASNPKGYFVVLLPAAILYLGLVTWASAQTARFDIVLVLDTGQNMIEADRFITEGARLAVHELGSSGRAAVITFASGIKLNLGFSDNSREISQAVGRAIRTSVARPGKQRLYDAIFMAIQQFPATPELGTKRVVAVLTNDVDRGSTHGPSELMQEAKSKGVAIRVFLVGNPYPNQLRQGNGYPTIPYPDVNFAQKELRPLALATGGEALVKELDGYVLRQVIMACRRNAE